MPRWSIRLVLRKWQNRKFEMRMLCLARDGASVLFTRSSSALERAGRSAQLWTSLVLFPCLYVRTKARLSCRFSQEEIKIMIIYWTWNIHTTSLFLIFYSSLYSAPLIKSPVREFAEATTVNSFECKRVIAPPGGHAS